MPHIIIARTAVQNYDTGGFRAALTDRRMQVGNHDGHRATRRYLALPVEPLRLKRHRILCDQRHDRLAGHYPVARLHGQPDLWTRRDNQVHLGPKPDGADTLAQLEHVALGPEGHDAPH